MSLFPDWIQLMANLPALPKRWSIGYLHEIIKRENERITTLGKRIDAITLGQTMPELTQVAIGSGKHFNASILFLDICGFTNWPGRDHTEQRTILMVMDVFMSEMMNIIRDHGGEFEKNTGDGLMAYFGTETSSITESIHPAVEAAVVMHYINDRYISPWLVDKGLWPVRFKIGIDYGEVTIGRIGIRSMNSFVALGCTANIACRLMELIPNGGISIGDTVFWSLPQNWSQHCSALPPSTGHVYVHTNEPYPAWELRHRLADPVL